MRCANRLWRTETLIPNRERIRRPRIFVNISPDGYGLVSWRTGFREYRTSCLRVDVASLSKTPAPPVPGSLPRTPSAHPAIPQAARRATSRRSRDAYRRPAATPAPPVLAPPILEIHRQTGLRYVESVIRMVTLVERMQLVQVVAGAVRGHQSYARALQLLQHRWRMLAENISRHRPCQRR